MSDAQRRKVVAAAVRVGFRGEFSAKSATMLHILPGGPNVIDTEGGEDGEGGEDAPIGRDARCDFRPAVVKILTKKFAEARIATGLVGDQLVMELYLARSGTWSVVLTGTNGVSCLLIVGDTFEPIALPNDDL
jgi:hypothetical protein